MSSGLTRRRLLLFVAIGGAVSGLARRLGYRPPRRRRALFWKKTSSGVTTRPGS